MRLSICILSYNRPFQIRDLLNSIDYKGICELEINIIDDFSPRANEIKDIIELYKSQSGNCVRLYSHEKNLGYDKTLFDLVEMASGDWIVFMGDDDFFVPGALDKYINFILKPENQNLGYILKSHYNINESGKKEYFRYYKNDKKFDAGINAYKSLFRKSVFISGFLIKSELAKKFNTHDLDGTLLLQLYLLARVVLTNESCYLREFFTFQYTYNRYEKNEIMYDRDKEKFVKRIATKDISLNFMLSYQKVINYIDIACNISCKESILLDMSKYSYPSLAVQRNLGVISFTHYCFVLFKMGFGSSLYFYFYYLLLIFLGKNLSDKLIYGLRNKLGTTPSL
jgi:glycosyltransferase involved in cell wall biosynthesis